MVSSVLKSSISGLLVFAFCTAGIVKITDKFAPEVHKQMKRDFVELAKVHPLKVWFGRNVNPQLHRLMIGYIEVICGLLLYGGPRTLKLASTVILLIVMAVMMQGLYWLRKPAVMFAPAACCIVLLLLNLVNILVEKPQKEKKKE